MGLIKQLWFMMFGKYRIIRTNDEYVVQYKTADHSWLNEKSFRVLASAKVYVEQERMNNYGREGEVMYYG